MTELPERSARQVIFHILLIISAAGISLYALLLPSIGQLSDAPLKVGDVAPQDILAPYNLTYESAILTENQRKAAAEAVLPVYSVPDTSIARRQLDNLRNTLGYISSVRSDAFASQEQKITDLAALEDIRLDRATAVLILSLSDSRWQIVQQEAIRVLEQVMRGAIREDQLDLALLNTPSLISLSLPEDQAELVNNLVTPFVQPNSFYDETLTDLTRQGAREAIKAVSVAFIINETIVQHGQVITPTDLEAIQAFGLIQPRSNWQNVISAIGITLLLVFFYIFYFRVNPILKAPQQRARGLTVFVVLLTSLLLAARLLIPGHVVVPYLFPLSTFSLIIALLFGDKLGMVSALSIALLTAYELPNSLSLTIYYTVSSFFGILALGRARRFTSYLRAGAAIAVSGALISTIFWLPQTSADWVGLLTLLGAAMINSVAAASLSLLLHYFLAQFMGSVSAIQLTELSRPDHPLLQIILRNAPGTYQHSLLLANLAEQAAERVGADGLLTRVGALYHDAGKAINPFYFIENQIPGGENPHEMLTPEESAAIILRHVPDGLELARKYRLPGRLQDFIAEHHGTMITSYQYARAMESTNGGNNSTDIEKFRYPGPRPRSKETALLMLADGCEARIRAERPSGEEQLRLLITDIVDSRLKQGQLSQTSLTLRDLETVIDTFTASLQGVFHPRIQYPRMDQITPELQIPSPSAAPEDQSQAAPPSTGVSPDLPQV